MTSTMGDENRVTSQESDEYDPKPESTTITPQESDEYDLINPEPKHSKYYYDYDRNGDMPNPFAVDPLSDNDDQIAHHINLNNEGQNKETMTDNHKQAYYYLSLIHI